MALALVFFVFGKLDVTYTFFFSYFSSDTSCALETKFLDNLIHFSFFKTNKKT